MSDVLKNALSTLINVGEKFDDAEQDGKISIGEGIGIAVSAIGLIKVFKQGAEIKAAFLALTAAEKTDLVTWFKAEFQLHEAGLETIIETIFAGIIQLSDGFNAVAAAVK